MTILRKPDVETLLELPYFGIKIKMFGDGEIINKIFENYGLVYLEEDKCNFGYQYGLKIIETKLIKEPNNIANALEFLAAVLRKSQKELEQEKGVNKK